MTAVLEVRRLSKSFRGFEAVSDVSLDVEPSQIYGLIGPNGAGKSTLLHLIFGREYADRGTVRFAGQEVTKTPPHARARLGLGLKLQLTSVFPHLTVEENLRLGELVHDSVSDKHRAAVLAHMELDEKRSVRAAHLSHGDAKWLEIAMVMLAKPKLLLLDEPTAGMDPGETRRSAELFKALRDDRLVDAVVIVEHDMEFIRQISDRLAVLHRGRVLANGSVEEVRRDPHVQDAYLGRAR